MTSRKCWWTSSLRNATYSFSWTLSNAFSQSEILRVRNKAWEVLLEGLNPHCVLVKVSSKTACQRCLIRMMYIEFILKFISFFGLSYIAILIVILFAMLLCFMDVSSPKKSPAEDRGPKKKRATSIMLGLWSDRRKWPIDDQNDDLPCWKWWCSSFP